MFSPTLPAIKVPKNSIENEEIHSENNQKKLNEGLKEKIFLIKMSLTNVFLTVSRLENSIIYIDL